MKNLFRKTYLFYLPVLLILFTTCDEEIDECNKTDLGVNAKNITIKVYAYFTKDDKPVEKQNVIIEFHKIACGSDKYKVGGDFTFRGTTNADGIYQNGIVGYSIRNIKDRIIVIISYDKGGNIFEQAEYHEYTEDDFKNGLNNFSFTIRL